MVTQPCFVTKTIDNLAMIYKNVGVIGEWSSTWQLKFNVDKCKLMMLVGHYCYI